MDGLANAIFILLAAMLFFLCLASLMVEGSDNDLVSVLFYVAKHSLQASEEVGQMEAYHTLSMILEKHSWFCSSQFDVVMDVLAGIKPSANIMLRKSRLTCLWTLLIHGLKARMGRGTEVSVVVDIYILGQEKIPYRRIDPVGCNCVNGCSESHQCPCVVQNEGDIPYNENGSIIKAEKSGVHERPVVQMPPRLA
ncbi:hypothetical protein PHJA_001365800 [Phtheirospermum japonicum]|uniref:Uncharacterized protein n=1 Tax=Phtheirospermum japonicum TaxID=374723 RepID=A0A830BW18_9LAMI|nr:hypothetical protein PHJA_001365800 [Phtheirospermum japonicum]